MARAGNGSKSNYVNEVLLYLNAGRLQIHLVRMFEWHVTSQYATQLASSNRVKLGRIESQNICNCCVAEVFISCGQR